MCDMFLILKTVYFTDYADNNNPFLVADNVKVIIRSMEEVRDNIVTWFSSNHMKLNPDKCYCLLNTKKHTTLKIGNLRIKKSPCVKTSKTFAKNHQEN